MSARVRTFIRRSSQVIGALLAGFGALAAVMPPDPTRPVHPSCTGASLTAMFGTASHVCHVTAQQQALSGLALVVLGLAVILGVQHRIGTHPATPRTYGPPDDVVTVAPVTSVPPEADRSGLPLANTRNTRIACNALTVALAAARLGLGGGVAGIVIAELATLGGTAVLLASIGASNRRRATSHDTTDSFRTVSLLRTTTGKTVSGNLTVDPSAILWETNPRSLGLCPSFTVPTAQVTSAFVANGSFLRLTTNLRMTVAGHELQFEVLRSPAGLRERIDAAVGHAHALVPAPSHAPA
jgi:hypothetical protein